MVFLLHFSRPYKQARHFVGAVESLDRLLAIIYDPKSATKSPLLLAAHSAGVKFTIEWTRPGDVRLAQRLRARRDAARRCQSCRAELAKGCTS